MLQRPLRSPQTPELGTLSPSDQTHIEAFLILLVRSFLAAEAT